MLTNLLADSYISMLGTPLALCYNFGVCGNGVDHFSSLLPSLNHLLLLLVLHRLIHDLIRSLVLQVLFVLPGLGFTLLDPA